MTTKLDSPRKAKINWHCRRGMLELDLIFERFVKQQLELLSLEQVTTFEMLLAQPDPDLYAWLMGYDTPEQKDLADLVSYIRLHDNTQSVK